MKDKKLYKKVYDNLDKKDSCLKAQKKRRKMKARNIFTLGFLLLPAFAARTFSYPPAVGILGKAKSCLACCEVVLSS